MQKQTQILQVLLAAMCLTVGLLVYLLDRRADQTYFVPNGWTLTTGAEQVFGALGAHLPSFVHVVVFILISSALLAPWRFRIASVCLLWFGVDSLFELGQHDTIANRIADFVPSWFQGVPFLENTASYFVTGTFDPLDLGAIALGTVTAFLMVHFLRTREKNDVPTP